MFRGLRYRVNRQQDPGNGLPLSDVPGVFLPRALSDCYPSSE